MVSQWDEIGRLVERSRRGDEEAFRELLQRHRSAVSSTLFACGVRCQETARDLAQDVAIKAWLRLDSLGDAKSFPAWIRRVAANAARDHLRRRAVRREDELEGAIHLESGDDPHLAAERVSELRMMLVVLESEDAEVVEFLVARAEGVGVSELAERAGVSEGALKMRLMRVRKRLRQRLDELRGGS